MINVGIIGCGRIADLHCLGYKDNSQARIYAVCDRNPERAEARRTEWGAERAYTDHRQLLQNPDIDAVEILTPFETHEAVAIDAMKAEKHVAVQKPMTTTLHSADRMVQMAEKIGTVFKVTECYVCYPPLVLAKKLIDAGEIGEPAGMRIKYICGPDGGWDVPPSTYEQQMAKAAQGFGLETFDHGHHEWATAWYLLGSIEKVSAWIDSIDGLLDCPATVMWKHREGKRYGMIDFIYGSDLHVPTKYYPNDEWYEINGSRGMILVNQGTGNILNGPAVSVFNGYEWKHIHDVATDWAEGFIGSTRNFIAAIQGKEPPLLNAHQGLEIMRFATAVAQSARKRREVYLDEFDHAMPALYSWLRRFRERKHVVVGSQRSFGRSGGGTARYASQAIALTERLSERFDPDKARGWSCLVGVHLTAEGVCAEETFTVSVRDGRVEIKRGELPQTPTLTLRMPAGLWAAILLGEKRIETAVLMGKIKYEGRAEEALRLRSAFKL